MIPKMIHYCWFGKKPKPMLFKKCMKSWKRFCPEYQIIEWNEDNFDVNCHPFVRSAYDAGAWAFVSDYARLKVIYDNGGIYLDTDVELLKNLEVLRGYQCYIGTQQSRHLCTTGLGFGAVKCNLVVRQMLKQYDGIVFREDIKEKIACPLLNNAVLEKMGYIFTENLEVIENTLILPPKYLDPVSPGKMQEDLLCEDTISIHHYMASWTPLQQRVRRKLFLFLGQRNINKVKKVITRRKKI